MTEEDAERRVMLSVGFEIHELKATSKIDDLNFLIGSVRDETYTREDARQASRDLNILKPN